MQPSDIFWQTQNQLENITQMHFSCGEKASRENRPAAFSGGEKKTSREHHPNTFARAKREDRPDAGRKKPARNEFLQVLMV